MQISTISISNYQAYGKVLLKRILVKTPVKTNFLNAFSDSAATAAAGTRLHAFHSTSDGEGGP